MKTAPILNSFHRTESKYTHAKSRLLHPNTHSHTSTKTNTAPFFHSIPVKLNHEAEINNYVEDSKNIGNGWYKLSPLLNAWVNVLDTGRDVPSTVWMVVYVKEYSSVSLGVPHKPVPKKSLIYDYISSKNPHKQEVLKRFEKEILEAFLEARRFIPLGYTTQTGIEIVDGKDFFMSIRGILGGVEIAYPQVDKFLEIIENGDEEEINHCKNYFRAAFAHEIVHIIRGEIQREEDTGQEIATHAIEILAGFGENPFKDNYLNHLIENVKDIETSYHKDIITAIKVVQYKLTHNKHCLYVPQGYQPEEINKAIKSIPQGKREKVLKDMTQEIIHTDAIELLRQAAQINVVPISVFQKRKELEKAAKF